MLDADPKKPWPWATVIEGGLAAINDLSSSAEVSGRSNNGGAIAENCAAKDLH
jgi:hypothetical protein